MSAVLEPDTLRIFQAMALNSGIVHGHLRQRRILDHRLPRKFLRDRRGSLACLSPKLALNP